MCPKVTAARAELARAQRRAELEAVVGMAVAPATPSAKSTEAVTVADPGAAALSTYLAALGLTVKPDAVSQWLVLVPVIALELGSAFAGILAGMVNSGMGNGPVQGKATARRRPVITVAGEPVLEQESSRLVAASVTAPEVPATANEHGPSETVEDFAVTALATIPTEPVRAAGRDEAAERILALLHDNGGTVDCSRFSLGKAIAATPSTAYAAVVQLAALGTIISEPSSTGTTIRLAA